METGWLRVCVCVMLTHSFHPPSYDFFSEEGIFILPSAGLHPGTDAFTRSGTAPSDSCLINPYGEKGPDVRGKHALKGLPTRGVGGKGTGRSHAAPPIGSGALGGRAAARTRAPCYRRGVPASHPSGQSLNLSAPVPSSELGDANSHFWGCSD